VIRPGDRVAVVGGGLLGLTLALRLAPDHRVIVLEAGARLGGLAAPATVETESGPVTWDRYYHVTLESDATLRALLRALDLDREIRWSATRTGYLDGGRLSPLSSPRDFLALPGLPWAAKVRLAATIARGTLARDWRRLERVPVETWLVRWSGRRTFDRFWVPLLEAKLGDAWQEASAAFIWATIQRLSSARRAGLGAERLGSVPGGYGRVTAALRSRLEALGARVLTEWPVDAVTAVDGGVEVRGGTRADVFDHVVVTTSPRVAAELLPGAPDRERLRAVRAQGIVCVSLLLRRALSPYYLTYLMDRLPFTAIVEMTNVVPPAWTGGWHLVYLPRYCRPDDVVYGSDDETVVAGALAGLRRVHALTDDDIVATSVARAPEVFPLPVLEASRRVPPVRTGVPGVHLVSSAQIVNGTLNVDETVARAEAAWHELTGRAGERP
jgi:protoporphyrinogen oxidase